MIDTIEQASCKICGRPIVRKVWVPHKREFCSGRCKQVDYRNRKRAEKQGVTIAVTMNEQVMQQRIAELEQEIATLKALRGRRTRGKDRIGLQERLMVSGQACGYKSLSIRVVVGQGVDAWLSFAREASEDMLARAIVAATS